MRNRVFSNSPRTQVSVALGLMTVAALSLAGCGGGSGGSGSSGPPPGSSLATITGVIKDTSASHNPVQGATVTISGTTRSAVTDATGTFTVTNVPLTATSFTVSVPSGGAYYAYANYQGKYYSLAACVLALPAVSATTITTSEVDVYLGGSNPPPPPMVGGCPS